jgi:glutamate formiminotransferase/glutamate formiminotransferase/formiminotetrahydrofolate cyclodeaminase
VLECVINISEGRDRAILDALGDACGPSLLDVHTDPFHNRSVFTLAGTEIETAARRLARSAVEMLDIRHHAGVHPRIGMVDVVPFVPLPGTDSSLVDAQRAQRSFAEWVAAELHVPVFLYGNDRSLPEVRKGAFRTLQPDTGPSAPHPSAGAMAVGCREVLVAYNLWLPTSDVALARAVAKRIRRPGLRALGLDVGGMAQVSCNLVTPFELGPQHAYDIVANETTVDRAELVGLLPRAVLHRQSPTRWSQLDIGEDKTIEARLSRTETSSRKDELR